MLLFEHPDFEQAILRAAEYYREQGLRPAIIEKDYYVTEALRIIAHTVGDKAIFKGGTSLSKGWNLIQRFSEDIDVFFDPTAFNPPLGKHGIDRELRRLRDAISQPPALEFVKEDSQTIGGFGRSDAIFPPSELAVLIGTEYERQCRILCYGPFPTWAEIRARFSDMRELL